MLHDKKTFILKKIEVSVRDFLSKFNQNQRFPLDLQIWDALRNLVPFVKLKERENNHAGVLLLVKFQALD